MPDDEDRSVRLGGVEFPDYLRPTYANFANVNHTPWDFRIMFALVTTPLPGQEQNAALAEGETHPKAVAEIILPANLMHGFISALQENFSKYLTQFGPPGMDPEGPRRPDAEEEE